MVRLKSIGVLSAAKVSALFHVGISLVFIPFFLFATVLMTLVPRNEGEPSPALFLVFALVAPFLYGAMGFVFGAIAAFIYNLVAGWIGGLELRLENIAPAPVALQAPDTPKQP